MKNKKWLKILSLRAIVAGCIAGGILHILIALAIPYVNTTSAFNNVAPVLPENKLLIAPVATSKSALLPFMTPEVRYALCRYNIHKGPVRISARLLKPSWTLALYTPQGDNFHTTTGLASQKNDVTFDLIPPAKKLFGLFSLSTPTASDRVTVQVPGKTGLMVLRAPISGTAFTDEVEKTLQLASCKHIE